MLIPKTKNTSELLPQQVKVKDKSSGLEWIYDVDPEEFDFLKDKGEWDDSGNLVLNSPLIAGIKGFSPDKTIESVEQEVIEMQVPALEIDIDTIERPSLKLEDLNKCTNLELEEYLAMFGAYRAYLEAQLSLVEARRGILESSFEEGLNKMYYTLEQKYRSANGRKPVKESLRGEALASNPNLGNLRKELIQTDALYIRTLGLRNAYKIMWDTVSRVIALRTSAGRDQV